VDEEEQKAALEEALDNLREAHHRIRAAQTRMWATGLSEHPNYRELSTRLSMALASTEAAYMEVRRRFERGIEQ
jgi:hypothetical protein